MIIMTRCKYLEHLNLSGLDEHSTPADYNDLLHSAEVRSILTTIFILGVMTVPQVKEHYLNLIEDAVRELPSLVNLNLGTLVNNGILRIVSKTCPRLSNGNQNCNVIGNGNGNGYHISI